MNSFHPLIAAIVAFCALLAAPASAQQAPGDLYTVAGVRVDETATSPAAARTQAMASVQRTAFDMLARRLVAPAQLANVQRPPDPTLDRLVRGVDVEEQPRTSGTRYLGRFSVRFDPAGVKAYLQGAGVTATEARGQPVLIVPALVITAPNPGVPAQADPWRTALEQGGYSHEATPIIIAPATVMGPADWPTAAPAAEAMGISSAVFAIARNDGVTLSADLVETSATGRTNRGKVSVPVMGGDPGLPDAFRRLAETVNASLQATLRGQDASTPAATDKTKISVSALYQNQADWGRIKAALAASAAIISEIRIEAVARSGALVSFSFSGSQEALAPALLRYGLELSNSPQGPVLRAVAR